VCKDLLHAIITLLQKTLNSEAGLVKRQKNKPAPMPHFCPAMAMGLQLLQPE